MRICMTVDWIDGRLNCDSVLNARICIMVADMRACLSVVHRFIRLILL